MVEQTDISQDYIAQIEDLRARLDEAEETLRAIHSGEVDALVVAGPEGNQIYTLKGADSTYRVLVEAMNEGALVLTSDGTVMYSNSSFADMVDIPLEQVIGSRIHRFVHEPHLETVDELLQKGQHYDAKCELGLKNESTHELVPAQMSVGKLPTEASGISAVVTDLTDQKRTEAELETYREHLEELVAKRTEQMHDSEARATSILNASSDSIWLFDREGRILGGNAIAFQSWGMTPDEMIGKIANDFVPADLAESRQKIFDVVIRDGIPARWEDERADVVFDHSAYPVKNSEGEVTGITVFSRDITERKQAAKTLDRTRFVLSEAQGIAHVGSFEYMVETEATVWSDEECRIYGLAPGSPSPNYKVIIEKFIHPDDAALLHETFTTAMQAHSVYELEHRIVRPDGNVRVVYDRAHPYFDAEGKLTGYIGATLDITERKKTEEALIDSEARVRCIAQASGIGLFEWNASTDAAYWSPEHYTLFGYEPDSPISWQRWLQGVDPKDRERVEENAVRLMGLCRTEGQVRGHKDEYRFIRPDGSVVWIESDSSASMVGDEIFVRGSVRDITEHKQAEEALRESERRYSALFANKINGMAHCRVITDEQGRPVNYRILEINEAYERIIGVKKADAEGRLVTEVFPGIQSYAVDYIGIYGKIALEGGEIKFEEFFEASQQYLSIYAYSPLPGEFIAIFTDNTDRAQAEKALAQAKYLLENQVNLLQRALIPAKPPIIEDYSVASAYIPAFEGEEVGGDFLDIFTTEGGKVAILIGDVSGKGIEAAAAAAITRSTIGAFAFETSCPSESMSHANAILTGRHMDFEHFVTSFLVILDPVTGELAYSGAGHPPAIIARANGETDMLTSLNMPLGVMNGSYHMPSHSHLMPGEKLVLYTDGISEARFDSGLLGIEGVVRVLSAHTQATAKELVDEIVDTAKDWSHGKLKDDTAVLIVRRDK